MIISYYNDYRFIMSFNDVEITGPTRKNSLRTDEEDYDDQFGSAEREHDEEMSNRIMQRNRPTSLTTLGTPPQGGTPYGDSSTYDNHVPIDQAPNCSPNFIPIVVAVAILFLRI